MKQAKSYTLKIRGGVDLDCYGKRAGKGALIQEELSATIGVSQDQYLFQPVGVDLYNQSLTGNVSKTPTNKATDSDHIPCVIQPIGVDIYNFSLTENVGRCLSTASGGLNEHIPCVIYPKSYGFDRYNQSVDEEKIQTLKTQTGSDDIQCCMQSAYIIENHPNDSRVLIREDGICQSLTGRMGTGGNNVPMVMERKEDCYSLETFHCNSEKNITPPLKARDYKDPLVVLDERKADGEMSDQEYIVRRLTPKECGRLQGFPDNWGSIDHKDDFTEEEYRFWLDVRNTFADINGKEKKPYTKQQMVKWYNNLHTDSAEYKMWGNGIALPCALYVMEGIAEELSREE